MKVSELSVEELRSLVQEVVEEKLRELLGDPDQGLELQDKLKERLRHSPPARPPVITAEKAAKDLGVK